MFHGYLDFFEQPPLGRRPNTKLGDHGTSDFENRWFKMIYHVWGSCMNKKKHWHIIKLRARSRMTSHYTWGPLSTLREFKSVSGRSFDPCFGLSQFHGHDSWLVCEATSMRATHKCPKVVPIHLHNRVVRSWPSSLVWSHIWPRLNLVLIEWFAIHAGPHTW